MKSIDITSYKIDANELEQDVKKIDKQMTDIKSGLNYMPSPAYYA